MQTGHPRDMEIHSCIVMLMSMLKDPRYALCSDMQYSIVCNEQCSNVCLYAVCVCVRARVVCCTVWLE